jgi:Kef-type K+ transport system membrane component KefB
MFGGIVLGPTVFGALAPEWHAGLFPVAGEAAGLRAAAVKLGMLFFMFTVGLDINPRTIRRNGLTAVSIGLSGTLVPLAVGIGLVYALPQRFGSTDDANRFSLALFIGAALANTAIPVLARILIDLGLLKERFGAIVMSAAVIDDLVSWTLLTVAVGQVATSNVSESSPAWLGGGVFAVAGFIVVMLLVGTAASAWFARVGNRRAGDLGGRIGVVSIVVLLSAAAAEQFGLHAFLGPFLFGVALTPTDDDAHNEAYDAIRLVAQGFFMPIYFVSLGLTTDFARSFSWPLVLAIAAAATIGKIPAAYAGARLGGLDRHTAWAVGCGMNARGAVGIILANLGLEKGVINEPTYVALVVMAIATSLFAGPTMKACLGRRGGL